MKAEVELELVRRLLDSMGQPYESLQPKQPPSPDIAVALPDGRRWAMEVTIVHADEGHGGSGGRLRAEEVRQTRAAPGRPVPMWGSTHGLDAVEHRIREKTQRDYSTGAGEELCLLLATSVPLVDGVCSTLLILEPDVTSLNDRTHELLAQSKFQRTFLHLHLGRGLYEWHPNSKWVIVHPPHRFDEGLATLNAIRRNVATRG